MDWWFLDLIIRKKWSDNLSIFLQEPEPTSLEDAMKESVSTYASSSSKSYEMLKLESLPTSGEHRNKVEKN